MTIITKINTLVDAFTSFNSSVWTQQTSGDISYSDGVVNIVAASSGYPDIKSVAFYDLTDSFISLQLLPPVGGSGATSQLVLASSTGGTDLRWTYSVDANTLTASSNSGYYDGSAVALTYNATSMAWVQISESGGTITWSTSPDGEDWTTRRTLNVVDYAAEVSVILSANATTTSSTTPAGFTNLNIKTVLYQVTQIGYPFESTSPLGGAGSGLIFPTLAGAEAYAASQYTAQTATPFYPFTWWTIQKMILEPGFASIPGYPVPGVVGGPPNVPTDITATTDGTNFTVSWVPNDPASPEYYGVTAYAPTCEFGINSLPTAGTALTDCGGDGSVGIGIGATAVTFSGSSWQLNDDGQGFSGFSSNVPYSTDLSFGVSATNAYGSTSPDVSTPSTSIIAFGPSGGIPAAPTDVAMTVASTTATSSTYSVTWNQPYPTGSGAPTSWLLFFTYPFGPRTAPVSGTPTTGNLSFTVSSSAAHSFGAGGVTMVSTNANGISSFPFVS